MEHILMTAETAHQLRIVTCLAFGGWQDGLFDPPNRHRGWGDGRESPRGETMTGPYLDTSSSPRRRRRRCKARRPRRPTWLA